MNLKDKHNLEEDIDALVSYIDEFMSKPNAGHMNIKVNENGHINKEEQLIDNTGNCLSGCKSPTLFEGLDTKESEE